MTKQYPSFTDIALLKLEIDFIIKANRLLRKDGNLEQVSVNCEKLRVLKQTLSSALAIINRNKLTLVS